MAAAVVSGAVALLLQEQTDLQPEGTRAVLQLTSSFMPEAGMIAAGAGSVNVLAAAELLKSGVLSQTTIAGEQTTDSGLFFVAKGHKTQVQQLISNNSNENRSAVRDGFFVRVGLIAWGGSDAIVWGDSQSIVWGGSQSSGSSLSGVAPSPSSGVAPSPIVWGGSQSIVWGGSQSIVWGGTLSRFVWGGSESIVWGGSESIVWGGSVEDIS